MQVFLVDLLRRMTCVLIILFSKYKLKFNFTKFISKLILFVNLFVKQYSNLNLLANLKCNVDCLFGNYKSAIISQIISVKNQEISLKVSVN